MGGDKCKFRNQHFAVKNAVIFKWVFAIYSGVAGFFGKVEVWNVLLLNAAVWGFMRGTDSLIKFIMEKKNGEK